MIWLRVKHNNVMNGWYWTKDYVDDVKMYPHFQHPWHLHSTYKSFTNRDYCDYIGLRETMVMHAHIMIRE